MENAKAIEAKYNKWIIVLSIVIPLVVGLLFRVKINDFGFNVKPLSFLPPIYATINGVTAVLLIVAVWAIKNKKQQLHEKLMKFAIFLSVCFLAMYVAYHMTSTETVYGGVGGFRYVYYFILISHILLSIIIIPFVLITYVRALSKSFERHRKIARITYPIWLYVAVTGVIVYIMISPYYKH